MENKKYTIEELSEILDGYYEKDQIDFICNNFLNNSENSQEVLKYCLERVEKLKELKTLRILTKIEKLLLENTKNLNSNNGGQ